MPKGIPKNGKRKPVKAVMTTQEYIESLERNLNHHVNRLDHVINDCVERIKASEQAIEARCNVLKVKIEDQRKLIAEIAGFKYAEAQLPSIGEVAQLSGFGKTDPEPRKQTAREAYSEGYDQAMRDIQERLFKEIKK